MNTTVTSASVIGFSWSNGLSTGGSPIIDYRISYDQSTGIFVTLATGVTTRSYTTSITLTVGASYTFRVEARNSVGYSVTSTGITIIAA